ncbi:hypothetical protein DPMN_090122 [Dreissena polymorpha]|uniref:Uncharacterized protein n=1 Tax=Dreissena polymorpha TaxID=45954 RepID=A0A9D4KX55_DREPO|nr:hypothetical protein DPMN_090122 [Dreissena polymorpha]
MRSGLQVLFMRRFWPLWSMPAISIAAMYFGYLHTVELDREAYAMRGQSNLFRADHEKLQRVGNGRQLWT